MRESAMKVFQTIQMHLALIGFKPNQHPFNTRQKWTFVEISFSMTTLYVYLSHVAQSPKEYMDSIFMCGMGTLVCISRISSIIKMKTIFIFIDEVEMALNARSKYPASKELYEKTNRQIEIVSKIGYFIVVCVSVPVVVLPKAFISFFKYFTTGLGSDAFELSIPVWYPFDSKNPLGYLIAIALQLAQTLTALHYVACFVILAIGCVMFSLAIATDIKDSLISIDESAKSKRSRPHMMEQLSEFIRFTNLRKLANYVNDIYQITLIGLFSGCIAAICLAMLMVQIDVSHYENNLVVVLESVFYGFWAINLVFVACDSVQRFTDAFGEIDDTIGQLHWYLYPVDIQLLFIPIMMNAQKPVTVKFFGSTSCCREQFRKAMYAAYSYFMVLRKFYQ